MFKLSRVLIFSLAALWIAAAVPAAAATSEARGLVVDHEGNPVAGLRIVFTAESSPTLEYEGTTNKKGRYFVPGLFTGKEDDRWLVRIDTEEYIPTELRVESRTANSVLVGGEIQTLKVKKGQALPKLIVKPLGFVVVDFKLSPPDLVQDLVASTPTEAKAGGPATPAPPTRDAWGTALTLAQDGDLEGSVEQFQKAIKDEPEDAERRQAFAQVLYRLGRFDEAEVEAAKAVELAPEGVAGRMVLYSVYVGKGDLTRASQALAEARRIAPNSIEVLRQVAFIASQGGTAADQIAANEAIVAVDPADTEAWLALGDLYAQAGDSARSEAAYQNVIEQDPQNADQVFFNLGALLINGEDRSPGTTQKAIGAFRKAVEINPKYAQAYKELAFALLNVGDRAGARRALENYLDSAPEAPDASQMKQIIKTLPEA